MGRQVAIASAGFSEHASKRSDVSMPELVSEAIEDCLKKVDNRFELVHMAGKRVRQIREGSDYLVYSPRNEDIVVALREIAASKVVKAPKTEEPE